MGFGVGIVGKIISENIVCIILVTFGVLAWIITIGARISSKRTGHYVSGVPFLGGILIIIEFLTSQVKWLALIGLLDFDLSLEAVHALDGNSYRSHKETISNFNKEYVKSELGDNIHRDYGIASMSYAIVSMSI